MNEHPTRCTKPCWNATHKKCRCGCGGKNHGIAKTQMDLFVESITPARAENKTPRRSAGRNRIMKMGIYESKK